jgi:Phosphodiester glycosidase
LQKFAKIRSRTSNLRIGFIFLLLAPGWLYAGWEVSDRKQPRTEQGNWEVAELEIRDGANRAELQFLFFAVKKASWRVAPNLGGALDDVEAAVQSLGGTAGINGGYFESNLSPLGLLISSGKRLHPLQKAKLLSGIFAIRNGHPELRRVSEYAGPNGVSEAIQCGPFLIDAGHPVPGLNDSRVAARTFVFACDSSIWGIGICRSVTLAEMGQVLGANFLVPGHRITRALNFDGGSSTGFYVKLAQGAVSSPGLKTVSNYLVLREEP